MHVAAAACSACSHRPTALLLLLLLLLLLSVCSFKPLQGVTSSMMVWLFENLHR
jgi:hypothetical protein